MKIIIMLVFLCTIVTANNLWAKNTIYYVDFDAGADTNTGLQGKPWKHCPGDPNAQDVASKTNLESGDAVYFRNGVVYRGQIELKWSGASGSPINYLGNMWDKGNMATIDGDYARQYGFYTTSVCSHVKIDSFVIQNVKSTGISLLGSGSDITISHCTVQNFSFLGNTTTARGIDIQGTYASVDINYNMVNLHTYDFSDQKLNLLYTKGKVSDLGIAINTFSTTVDESGPTKIAKYRIILESDSPPDPKEIEQANTFVPPFYIATQIVKPGEINQTDIKEPTFEPKNAAYWDKKHKRLYAVHTGEVKVIWSEKYKGFDSSKSFPTEYDDKGRPKKKSLSDLANIAPDLKTQETVKDVDWPADSSGRYQIHVANSPAVDLTANGRYTSAVLLDTDVSTSAKVHSNNFEATGTGRSLVMLKDKDENIYFQFIKTISIDKPVKDTNTHDVGSEIVLATTYHDSACGEPFVYHENSDYCALTGFHDRMKRKGPIIPVNILDQGSGAKNMLLIGYEKGSKLMNPITPNGPNEPSLIHWPVNPVLCTTQWPQGGNEIVIASGTGTGSIDSQLYPSWAIYRQNDPTKAGYNPNDEHALEFPANDGSGTTAIFALRSDIGSDSTSQPYVLMSYRDPHNKDNTTNGKIKVWQVIPEKDPSFFRYKDKAGTSEPVYLAGNPIDAPYPLSMLPACEKSTCALGPGWRDHKKMFWAKAAGDDGGPATIIMHYYYSVLEGFDFPSDKFPTVPLVGNEIPWLAYYQAQIGGIHTKSYNDGNKPVDITYQYTWPKEVPVLQIGETLIKAKEGLPAIDGQLSVDVIYQQSVAQNGSQSVMLFDPVVTRSIDLNNQEVGIVKGFRQNPLPNGISEFPDLPPHLVPRVLFHEGDVKSTLSFRGIYINPPTGSDWVLSNIMSKKDVTALKALLDKVNPGKAAWDRVVDNLYKASQTAKEIIKRRPLQIKYSVDGSLM